jgi:hypothetical protein
VVNELTPLTFTVNATDTHMPPLPLVYSIIDPPFNSSINATTGVFTWKPTETQGNGTTYAVTIRVSDGQLSTDRTVNITANEVNLAPRLATILDQIVNEGSLLTFTAVGSDTDIPANTLTYRLLNAPSGATIDPGTGVFNWTPTGAQGAGAFTFTVRVNDGNLDTDQPVTVNIIPSATTDTDGDGLSSLMEYALGTNPASPNASPFRLISANTNNTVTLTFTWNWQAPRLRWQLRHGNSLTNMANWPTVSLSPGTTTAVRVGNLDRITVSPATSQPDRGFYVLEVISD